MILSALEPKQSSDRCFEVDAPCCPFVLSVDAERFRRSARVKGVRSYECCDDGWVGLSDSMLTSSFGGPDMIGKFNGMDQVCCFWSCCFPGCRNGLPLSVGGTTTSLPASAMQRSQDGLVHFAITPPSYHPGIHSNGSITDRPR